MNLLLLLHDLFITVDLLENAGQLLGCEHLLRFRGELSNLKRLAWGWLEPVGYCLLLVAVGRLFLDMQLGDLLLNGLCSIELIFYGWWLA